MSKLIEVVNDRFGTEFNEADQLFFDAVEEHLVGEGELDQARFGADLCPVRRLAPRYQWTASVQDAALRVTASEDAVIDFRLWPPIPGIERVECARDLDAGRLEVGE